MESSRLDITEGGVEGMFETLPGAMDIRSGQKMHDRVCACCFLAGTTSLSPAKINRKNERKGL